MQVMKEGFERVHERFGQVDSKLDTSFAELAEAINVLSDSTDEQFRRMEAKMVTKDYLDEKLFDLRGDAVAMIRRHERKFHFRTV